MRLPACEAHVVCHLFGSIPCALTQTPPHNTNRQCREMLIVVEFLVKDQLELNSPELDSPLSSFVAVKEEVKESKLPFECLEKVWNMLSVQHCMPLAFSSNSIYLESENR